MYLQYNILYIAVWLIFTQSWGLDFLPSRWRAAFSDDTYLEKKNHFGYL